MKNRLLIGLNRTAEKIIFDLKLKYKLIIAFSFITLIPILMLGLTSSSMMRNNLQEMEEKALVHSLYQLNNTLDYFLGTYLNASSLLFRNQELQGVLNQETNDLADAIQARQDAGKIVYQVLSSLELPESSSLTNSQNDAKVRFYVTNTQLGSYLGDILPLEDIKGEAWFDDAYEPNGQPVWQSRVYMFDQNYIVLNRKLVDLDSFTALGVLRVFIPILKVKNIVENNAPPSPYRYYFVDDQYLNIIDLRIDSSDNMLPVIKEQGFTSDINFMKAGGKEYLVGITKSSVTGWRLIIVAPTDVITAKTRNVSTVTLLSVMIAFGLCILISIVFSNFLTGRIDVLVKKTNDIDKDRFHIQQTIQGFDEIGQLDQNFNRMVNRIDNFIENEYKSKLVVNKVKLELLQEQINPHLLYNTLSMISMIAKDDGQRGILKVTNSLIDFYKGILNRGKIITSFHEEINMALTYIDIMRFVYNLDLEIIVDIEDSIYDCYSIKLLLQPVVENAILHGLRQKKGGQIFIGGAEKDGAIEFVVADNGVGMPEEMKRFLNCVRDQEDLGKSYGLANVIKRIDLFWGREYGVTVEGFPGSGTTVILRIPRLSEMEITHRLESQYLT